tara:strand:- start:383 stop:1018 length:636 start_codon:yes stop_codon:yes gene_type:complete
MKTYHSNIKPHDSFKQLCEIFMKMEKVDFINYLPKYIKQNFEMIQEDNFKNLCDLTTSLFGLRKGSLAYKTRKQEYQIPRSVVSVIARMIDDIHPTVIAKVLKRDRVSVYHYERCHQSNYKSFPKYRDVFNKIYNAYSNIKQSKKTFTSLSHLQHHLKQNGIFHSDKHQTTIRITSGKVQVNIKSSYRDFYDKLENCKVALLDCNYNLEIV